MKIYTKTGDKGYTSLLSGTRVPKNHKRIEAYGTIDELNSFLGLFNSKIEDETIKDFILSIQKQLFTIGAILATDKNPEEFHLKPITDSEIERFEQEIDKMTSELEPLRNFILPGGTETISLCHVCRTICRRAERSTFAIDDSQQVDNKIIIYINRLSDYLFVLARYLTNQQNCAELLWTP